MRPIRSFGSLVLGLFLAAALASAQASLGKVRLTGTVKAGDGSPIAGAKVVLRVLAAARPLRGVDPRTLPSQESAVFEIRTNRKGDWSHAGLAAGLWEIEASADGFNSVFRTCKVLELADTPRVDLVLEKLPKAGSYTLAPGLLESANELARTKEYDAAILLYRQYLELDPEAITVMSAIGDCLMDMGDLEAALAQFHAVVKKTSADPREKLLTARALARIGECHIIRGDRTEADKAWRSALTLLPHDPEVPFNLAELMRVERKLEEAGRYYRIASELAPGWGEPHYRLGLIYLGLDKFDLARQSFQKVIEIDPYAPLAFQARDMLKGLDLITK